MSSSELFDTFNYQSYQSGIETRNLRRQQVSPSAINRTKVELKRPQGLYGRTCFQAINRTKVELKLKYSGFD